MPNHASITNLGQITQHADNLGSRPSRVTEKPFTLAKQRACSQATFTFDPQSHWHWIQPSGRKALSPLACVAGGIVWVRD